MDFVARSTLTDKNLIPMGELKESLQQTKILQTTSLLDPEEFIGNLPPQVKAKGTLQFVVMACSEDDSNWFVPPLQTFFDLISQVECSLIEKQSNALTALKWASQWGEVGLVGLSTRNLELLQDYRRALATTVIDNICFTSIPRDVLEPKNVVTLLLKEVHRHFKPEYVPFAILQRNPDLRGRLRTIRVKTHGPDDKTIKGQSKAGWRTIVLEGDCEFMTSLKFLPEDRRFALGAGHVFLHGGERSEKKKTSTQAHVKGKSSLSQPTYQRKPNKDRSQSSSSSSSQHRHHSPDRRRPRSRGEGRNRRDQIPREPSPKGSNTSRIRHNYQQHHRQQDRADYPTPNSTKNTTNQKKIP
jgi:hypothetical protein